MSIVLSVIHRTVQRDLLSYRRRVFCHGKVARVPELGVKPKPEYGTDSASTGLQSRAPTLLLTLLPTLFLPLLQITINLSITMKKVERYSS